MLDNLDVNELFKVVYDNGGSDLHVKYDVYPKMRKHGELIPLPGFENSILNEDVVANLGFQTMDVDSGRKDGQGSLYGAFLQDGHGLEYAYEATLHGQSYGRWRCSYYTSRNSHGFVARLLQDDPKTLEELNAYPTIYDLLKMKKGIIFVTGATGSGKSTLMGGMVDYLNASNAYNIISLEDPIEMIHKDKKSTVIQRDVGMSLDAKSFMSGLQSALRQDPDVILIGEIRSLETMKEAFVAANTGHLVITTLHTSSAAATVNRILKMYPADERDGVSQDLADALIGIISQQLVPAKAGGLTAVNEILVNTRETASIIREAKGDSSALYDVISRRSRGSMTFEQHYADLVKSGVISLDTAEASVNDIEKLEEALDDTLNITETPLRERKGRVANPEQGIASQTLVEAPAEIAFIEPDSELNEEPINNAYTHASSPDSEISAFGDIDNSPLNIDESEPIIENTPIMFSDIGEDSTFVLDFSGSEPMKFDPAMVSSEIDLPSDKTEVTEDISQTVTKEQLVLRLPKRVVKKKHT